MQRGFSLSLLLIVVVAAMGAKDEGNVGDMMERTHKGKRSAFRQVQQQLDAQGPQWDVIENQLPAFQRMAETLQKARKEAVREAADGYVDAVSELAKATKAHNLANLRKGFESLKNSCADCHYKGGPGGKLD